MLSKEIRKEAAQLVDWNDRGSEVVAILNKDLLPKVTDQSRGSILAEERKERDHVSYEEIKASLIGSADYNSESGKWEASLSAEVPHNMVNSDYELTFTQLHPDQERDANKDWQRYEEEAFKAELERRKNQYDKEDAVMMLTPEIYYKNSEGEIEKSFIASMTQYNENGQQEVRYTAMGYDRLPPDIKEEYEATYGGRENIVGKWIVDNDEMILKHNTFISYVYTKHNYDTWEEYRDAHFPVKQEEVQMQGAIETDEIGAPKDTPSVAEEDLTLKIH